MGELDPEIAEALKQLRTAKLFKKLTAKRAAGFIDGGFADTLAEVVEHYLDEHGGELALHSPQSAKAAIELVPELARVLRADADRSLVHLVHGDDEGDDEDDEDDDEEDEIGHLFKPETHHEWVGVYNAALRLIGDERRFAALEVSDPEEPRYLLVTPEQRDVLEENDLLAYDDSDIELPAPIWGSERAEELAGDLAKMGVAARAADDRVEITLDLAAAAELLARLHEEEAADARLRVSVNRRYGA